MSSYTNYEFYGDYATYVAALQHMGFTIQMTSGSTCNAYYKDCPRSVYLDLSLGTTTYSGFQYINPVLHIGENTFTLLRNPRRIYSVANEELGSGNVLYISDAYWDGASVGGQTDPSDDYFRITFNVPLPGHPDPQDSSKWQSEINLVVGTTPIRMVSNVAWFTKTFIKNFTSEQGYSLTITYTYKETGETYTYPIYTTGSIRKSTYKYTRTIRQTESGGIYSAAVGDVYRIYNNCVLPYTKLKNGGIAMPNFGTVFIYNNSDGEAIMMNPGATGGIQNYYMFALVPPNEESDNWIVVYGRQLFTCNENDLIEIADYLTTDPESAYYPLNISIQNEKLIAPIIDPYDENNCGAITDLGYCYGTSFSYLGYFAECEDDAYYLVKRTTAKDSSQRSDPYVYTFEVDTGEEEVGG